jgi:hypothetical protein
MLNDHLINNLWANFGERIELCDCIKTRGKNKRIYMIKGNDKETKRLKKIIFLIIICIRILYTHADLLPV